MQLQLVQVPPHIEQQVLQQFSTGFLGLPLPSAARQQAEQLQRLPQESVGLYVAPHPRASSSSLFKLEQRLQRARSVDVQQLVQQLQEQFPAAQQPAAEGPVQMQPGDLWLDDNGLMLYEPDPAKAGKQRTRRRYDQSDDVTQTGWLPAVTAPLTLLESRGVSYRLDVELARLEFEVHPYMTLEHQLAARLLCSFREYHRRAQLGLATFYANQLAALEDGLLNAREALFAAQEQEQDKPHQQEQVAAALVAMAAAERKVAEVRQLREEEDAALLAALEAMAGLWRQLGDVRERQRGLRLTDVGFSIVQLPHEDPTPLQADGLTRQQLDVALLVAEAENIAGLPPHPAALPLSQSVAELTSFALRRVESTASSHALLRAELSARLALLQDRVSADPDDPEMQSLHQQLQLLGPAPRRLLLSHQQEMQLWDWAEEEVTAGRVGVHRPPRLQPCLTVLPATPAGPRAAARLGSSGGTVSTSSARGAVAGDGSSPGPRSRLGWPGTGVGKQPGSPTADQQQQQHPAAASDGVVGLSDGQLLPISQQGPKLPVKLSYYARLLVNDRVVGTGEVLPLKSDYSLDFRDVFSLRLLKWPASMQLQIWEQGTFRDTLLCQFYLVVPGLAGTPHVDPQAKPYSWTSTEPVPHQKLLQAAAALQPLGVVPAVDAAGRPQQLGAAAAGSISSQAGAVGAAAGECGSVDDAAGGSNAGVKPRGKSVAAVYPSGRLFVRCGWVADHGVEARITPFEGSSAAFAAHLARRALHGAPGCGGDDGLVQVSVGGAVDAAAAASAGHGSPVKSRSAALSGAGLAGSAHASPGSSRGKPAAGVGAEGPGQVFGNPLAHIGEDVEVAQRLAPPLPHTKADKALQRAAIGGHKWLSQELLDPNDPRNAALLELLRTRSAAASSGAAGPGGAPDLFRLDLAPELALAVDRAADQRVTFIKQRWHAGPYRGPSGASGGSMQGLRQLSTVAPLSARDTLELQDAYREALALVEAASLGLASAGGAGRASSAPAVTAALNGRQERALKWSQGALAKAIEAREAGIRSFALRVCAACNQLGSGRGLGRHFKTDDVVKDAPLPEFKLDLSSLAAALAPARPLRPQRRAVKKLQAAGARFSTNSRFASRDRPFGTSYNGSSRPNYVDQDSQGFRSPGRATREGAALPGWEEAAAAGFDDEFSAAGEAAGSGSSNSSLSCFVELLFPVIGLGQEASPAALKESDGPHTVNLFDEVVTPTAAAKAARSAARAGQPGGLESLSEGPALPERERRFLGCLRVPLAAVYQAEVLAGHSRAVAGPAQPGAAPQPASSRPPGPPSAEPQEERTAGEAGGCGPPRAQVSAGRLQAAPVAALFEREDAAGGCGLWAEPEQRRGRGGGGSVGVGHQWPASVQGPRHQGAGGGPEGVSTLLTRYLAPAPLPPALAARAAQQLMLAAARWVAHVPFMDDASLGKRRSNVWASNADFVELAGGDHEEHAHLLAGFFLEPAGLCRAGTSTTGAHASFVLTTGRPLAAPAAAASCCGPADTHPLTDAAAPTTTNGGAALAPGDTAGSSQRQQPQQQQLQERLQQAAAVAQARQRAAQLGAAANPATAAAAAASAAQRPFDVSLLRLWNPLSGQCVPARDPACELREAGTLYSCDNVWANTQLSGHPWDISWALGDANCWRPFFGAVLPAREMACIQVPPCYAELEARVYEELEARVEETVRDALYEARSVVVTQPNNKLSRTLKALLKEVPGQLAAINAASMAASLAMADVNLAAIGGPGAAEAAKERLQQRLRLIQALQLSHNDRVAREMRGCLINGHILALPFSDSYAEAVAEAVLNTGLHRTVDLRPLGSAFVCCLWVYVAAIRETS
ncbi:hypothetical protein COO60DRAFT_1642856 [Scenedesmus sp. NREL 46B-D3]|nr:hypothetical protein COO60DRAFT_1642856 [Scenedesmus sp. NREL 46B-D3]